ncbi:MAG: hypothetical protein IT369_04650 [Candidatus Latescibacteria bacterium]|nr:hypothetical protein [Candidatus Latescibacterota bacterium]
MKCWIFVFNPLERYLANYREIFDAWQDGGVTGIVVGRMFFMQDDDTTVPAFPQDPAAYKKLGLAPPAAEPRDEAKEKALGEMLDDAKRRGWHIMVFNSGSTAHVQSLINRYPQVDGVIIDGPGENHYELARHHGGELFELHEYERKDYARLGYEVDRIERGIAHLRERFHQLTPDMVRYHAPGGTLAGLVLFDIDEDALYWLRGRQHRSLVSWQEARATLDKVDRYVELGGIPRITTWSSLTGQNYQQMPPYFDYIFPKHYYWHRGFDGMYGTVQRWVHKFREWNPSLSEEDGFLLMKSLFGLELPGVNRLIDLELGFPEEFFTQIVYQETRRALEAIKEVDKTIFWVSTGRFPHAGDPMPARDLDGILRATQAAGGTRFLFHPDPDPGPGEWTIITQMCGKPWRQSRGGYWPPDSRQPDEYLREEST